MYSTSPVQNEVILSFIHDRTGYKSPFVFKNLRHGINSTKLSYFRTIINYLKIDDFVVHIPRRNHDDGVNQRQAANSRTTYKYLHYMYLKKRDHQLASTTCPDFVWKV